MKTYQDLLAGGESDKERMAFVQTVINDAQSSPDYKMACAADEYYAHKNPTIMNAQQIIYDVLGKALNDPFKPNNKIPCRYYFYFINQAVQFLLGNGVTFKNTKTKDKLGPMFDHDLQRLLTDALNGGVSFGFWNLDHLEIMSLSGSGGRPCFAPLYDEETGALRSGVRWWQIDENKPLRATLFEEDGLTEYIKPKGKEMEIYAQKREYVQVYGESEATGKVMYTGQNWPKFPVIPMYNVNHQSELVGGQQSIDAYDLMMSGLVNNVDEGNLVYWVIQNAGGMSSQDDMEFLERIKTIHVAHTDGDQQITPQSIMANVSPNETALNQLRDRMFEDFMALDVKNIASGAATATQIEAAYEPMLIKSNLLEAQVSEFIFGLLELLGIKDEAPSYQRDTIVNKAEEVQTVLQAAEHLSDQYVTKKILTILGDVDQVEDVMKQKLEEETERYPKKNEGDGDDEKTENEEEETVPEAETVEE